MGGVSERILFLLWWLDLGWLPGAHHVSLAPSPQLDVRRDSKTKDSRVEIKDREKSLAIAVRSKTDLEKLI